MALNVFSSFLNHLAEEQMVLIVFLLSCGCLYFVSFPHDAVNWHARVQKVFAEGTNFDYVYFS